MISTWTLGLSLAILIQLSGCGETPQTKKDVPPENIEKTKEIVVSNQQSPTLTLLNIKIRNTGTDTVFLKANYQSKALINISSTATPAVILSIPENYFCPQWCPDNEKFMEIDCGTPRERFFALPPSEFLFTAWSGEMIVDKTWSSTTSEKRNCVKKVACDAGSYLIEVCAFKNYEATSQNGDFLRIGKVLGESKCTSMETTIPKMRTIEINI